MIYKTNKERAKYSNTEPSMTDQSLAASTDINIIVTQFIRTGQAPPTAKTPFYGDFTDLPEDLRGFIELGRTKQTLINSLPEQLHDLTLQELMSMTNEQLTAKLQPPNKPADKKDDNQ